MSYVPNIPGSSLPGGLTPAAFGGVNANAILTNYDLYAPQELTMLFERHSYRPGFAMMLDNMGYSKAGKGEKVGHWEADWKIDNITVGNIITASTGPGTTMVIELDPTNMISNTVAGQTVTGSYPVANDILKLPNGDKAFILSKNIGVNPHRLTLKPTRASVDLASGVVDGGTYFISDDAHAEGSGQPDGRISRVLKYNNVYQIVKAKVVVTGTELTNQSYFNPVPGKEGSFFMKSSVDTDYRFEMARDGALIFGQTIDNIQLADAEMGYNVPVKGTQGLIDYTEQNGYIDEYDPANYTIEDFDDIGRIYVKERIPRKDIMGIHGYEHFLLVENACVEFVQNTLVDFTIKKYFGNVEDYGYDSQDFALSVGFQAIKKGGYLYMHKVSDAFNDIKYAGTTGYNYPYWCIYMPVGKTADMQPESSGDIPTIGYEYKSLNGYNRKAEMWNTGGAGPITKTDEFDKMRSHYRSEIAFHGACANQVIINRPAA